ncbi:MAG: phosphotransferase [bacterium]|nr:phosphotransferase [bacterium]
MTTDFHTLDRTAQAAHWEALAMKALVHFGLAGASLNLLTDANNAVYRVDGGLERFMLRLHRPAHRSRTEIESERAWLSALCRETDLCVPQPVGDIYEGRLAGVDVPVYAALFRWIDGEQRLPYDFTREQSEQIGAFIARLHNHSAGHTLPPGFTRPRRDWAGLFGNDDGTNDDFFTNEQQAIMAETGRQVRAVMDGVDTQPGHFGLIHADLIAKNLLWKSDLVCAIDFDDCGHGYYLYDLAPMLWMSRDEPGYADLRTGLWTGYTSVRPQPQAYLAMLEALVAARHVASCYWVAGNRHNPNLRDRAHEVIAYRINELRIFLERGALRP